MSDFLAIVGSQIKSYRKAKGFTQEELAELSSLNETYIGSVERGERNISLLTLQKILEGLDITPSILFSYNNLSIDQELNKKNTIDIITNHLQTKDLQEINLLKNILFEIINYTSETHKSGK